MRPHPLVLLWLLSIATPALALNLGGVDVPKDKFIVYLLIGHSNMAGRVDDIDTETYETHPRAWNFKFDDGTDAWIPAQPPVHRDVSWQRGGGPATPFLKRMAEAHPGYYFGSIQNAHSSVTVVDDYRRGQLHFDEIVAVATTVQSDITFGGVLAMLGAMEAGNAGQAADFANQITRMMNELRQDLGEPDLPLLINRLTRGGGSWQTVQNQIQTLPSALTFTDIVPSDGPYKPNDNVHYTWVGQKAWGQAASDLITANAWFPGTGADTFGPRIARTKPLDETTVEVVFDESLDPASSQISGNYQLAPGVSIGSATLQSDQKTVTLITGAMTSWTDYVLTAGGIEDVSSNATSGEATSFTFVNIDIPKASLSAWLRGDSDVIRISGDFVPLWTDQSGAGNDFIRARFANQPQWQTGLIAGEPGLRFGGPQDTEVDFMTRILPTTYTGDSTLFFVFRLGSVGQNPNAALFSSDTTAGGAASFQIEVDGGNPGTLQVYTANSFPIGPANANPHLLAVRIGGTSLEVFLDGAAAGSYTIGVTEAKTHSQYTLGGNRALSEFLAFDVAELLIYETALSPSDRQRVEQYLGPKYGLISAPPGISVIPSGGLTTTESGGTDTFSVALSTGPSQDVAIPLSSSNPAEGTVAPTSLLFSSSNWNTAQTVTVTGVDDATTDGDITYTIVLDPAASMDPSYSGLDATDVTVTNIDDDGVTNVPPNAVIAGPATSHVGIVESYYGGNSTDDGNIVSYSWDFGDGTIDSGQLVSHAWAQAGIYTITLIVTDDGGLTGQTTQVIDVGRALQPSTTLIRPTGGEVWQAGSMELIEWSTVDLDDIRIDFSPDGGATWQLVAYSDINDANWRRHPWVIPDLDSTQCIIKVQGYNFEAPQESGLFTIVGSGMSTSINLTNPSQGDTLSGRQNAPIRWVAPNSTSVVLEFSLDGESWEVIGTVGNQDPSWGDFAWAVPNVSTRFATLRIRDSGSADQDASGPFSIVPNLSSPPGGLEVTRVTFTVDAPSEATGSLTSAEALGRSFPKGTDGRITIDIEIPTGIESIVLEITGTDGAVTHRRKARIDLEDTEPPIPGLSVSAKELRAFFGDRGGILAWVAGAGSIQLVDFRNGVADPQVEVLSGTTQAINPLFSPDGTRIVFSQGAPNGPKLIFLTDLAGGSSTPIGTGDIGYWHVDPGTTDEHIVYCDWSSKTENGAGGMTHSQKLNAGQTTPDGQPTEIHDRAMDAGPNKNLTWLGQVYNNLWAYDLSTSTDYPTRAFFLMDGSPADHQTCNGSMAPDATGRMMVLVIPHDWIRIFSHDAMTNSFVESSRFNLPAGMVEWEFPEWSTDPGFFTAILRAPDFKNRLHVAKVNEGEIVPELLEITDIQEGAEPSYSHLYLEP